MKAIIRGKQKLSLLLLAAAFVGIGAGLALFTNRSTVITAVQCPASVCAEVNASGINPDVITLEVGKKVQFSVVGDTMHNLALGKGEQTHGDGHGRGDGSHDHNGSFSSGDFGAGEAWQATFSEPGTYHLHDHYDPSLQVTVVVYQPEV